MDGSTTNTELFYLRQIWNAPKQKQTNKNQLTHVWDGHEIFDSEAEEIQESRIALE